jgi:hypothetical protein
MAVREKRSPKLVKLLKMPKNLQFRSGILEKGQEGHKDAGMTIAELGEIHEFGLGVPERSFVRAWFDARQQSILDLMRRQFTREIDPNVAADRVALALQAEQRNWINEKTNLAPNVTATIARKGSDVPLVDTGVLRSAIETVVLR